MSGWRHPSAKCWTRDHVEPDTKRRWKYLIRREGTSRFPSGDQYVVHYEGRGIRHWIGTFGTLDEAKRAVQERLY